MGAREVMANFIITWENRGGPGPLRLREGRAQAQATKLSGPACSLIPLGHRGGHKALGSEIKGSSVHAGIL